MNKTIEERLKTLQSMLKDNNFDAFYFSGSDPHSSEYLANHWKTIPFFSGFTGSTATMLVTNNSAALWTDSRYFLQAKNELEGTNIELMKLGINNTPTHLEWLDKKLGKNVVTIASELSCLPLNLHKNWTANLDISDGTEIINTIWSNRPSLPTNTIYEHKIPFCAISRNEKIEKIRKTLIENSSDWQFLSSLDDIAWTFNLRGSDIEYNPVFFSYAIIGLDSTYLFVNQDKISSEIKNNLIKDNITLLNYNEIFRIFDYINGEVRLDINKTNSRFASLINSTNNFWCENKPSIPSLLKACKNNFELDNIKTAMQKDGIAVVKFLFWIENNINKGQKYNEYDLVETLNELRSKQINFIGNSFFPIISYKENGAIVHRTVTKDTAMDIEGNGLLLFDSGGQYFEGTTDITRTIIIGTPNSEEINNFTLVLKGMIALSEIKFPEGTPGCNLDVLARQSLWQQGLNYGHGTGHGIGYFLNVHEGPQGIRQDYNPTKIEPGMVISNEPGLYLEDKFGIRIENAIVCKEWKTTKFGKFLKFETLTICPIDKRLIDKNLLTNSEINWINNYHRFCYTKLSASLTPDEQIFLAKITEEI